jgi:glycosyltransferase involved in cell wall biosynthesis
MPTPTADFKANTDGGPRLTIGMPAYNSARTIRRAIDSLVAQTFTDFRLVVSDDGSSDDTARICDEYAVRDSRITVIRQPKNLNYGNFRFLLQNARTPLFMFAPSDDWWHPDYARRMIEALDADPRAVCAVSRVAFMRGDVFVKEAGGTGALTADPATNIARFISAPDDNSRMCGVLRTEVARRAFPERDFFAYDWATSIGTLREGTHVEVPETLLWRDYTEPTRYIEYVHRDAHRALDRVFPMLPLTRDVVGRLGVPMKPGLVKALVSRNVAFHSLYMRRYHPRIAAAAGAVPSAAVFVVRAGRSLFLRVRRAFA